jgi:hypothetical protein
MRCGNRIVQTGDTKLTVLAICGEPEMREVVGYREGPDYSLAIEEWTYLLGRHRLIRILTFEGNHLVSIETGRRVP